MEEFKGLLESITIQPGGAARVKLETRPIYAGIDLVSGDLTWGRNPGQKVTGAELLAKTMTASPVMATLYPDPTNYGLVTKAEFYVPGA